MLADLRGDLVDDGEVGKGDRPRSDRPTRLRAARAAAATLAEARGWTRWIISDVDRALVMLLSTHTADDMIRFSELFAKLRHHGLSVGRTVEVLARIGLLDDDRIPAFDRWPAGKLSGIAPGIAADVEAWARLLHERTSPSSVQHPGRLELPHRDPAHPARLVTHLRSPPQGHPRRHRDH
ncbi:hypothetical protein ABZU75_12110 [Streptosporangium sp. NPDC005286]|uniref:hypothetical protein n=1 Tax=Streptosporangium sp. NPDC005286 TaxID=3154463 RepID=UPI00339E36C9